MYSCAVSLLLPVCAVEDWERAGGRGVPPDVRMLALVGLSLSRASFPEGYWDEDARDGGRMAWDLIFSVSAPYSDWKEARLRSLRGESLALDCRLV